jgi:hypothetical protein
MGKCAKTLYSTLVETKAFEIMDVAFHVYLKIQKLHNRAYWAPFVCMYSNRCVPPCVAPARYLQSYAAGKV